MTVAIAQSGILQTGQIVNAASVKGRWKISATSLKTAETTGLVTPAAITRSDFEWTRVPDGATRLLLRSACSVNADTFTTQPVVRLYGGYLESSPDGQLKRSEIANSQFSQTVTASNFAHWTRLDSADINGTGITLTSAATNQIKDSAYTYSDVSDNAGYDLLGAHYIGVVVVTAGVITDSALGAVSVFAQYLFLN